MLRWKNGQLKSRLAVVEAKIEDLQAENVKLKEQVQKLQWGEITGTIVATAGDRVPAEIEYKDCKGNVIGYWAYGYFHPGYPFQG